ncbi:uncharacterized protein LOC100905058 [Galendromus occidentalis]|uniref:Uncharacterized protein LOC100905058 n=1 Tax=Galendromus occidentalis TaxID=34638 RepID=A0AAJ6QVP5_9ACAR|nr:uncharacterized protein LOC100905058 [Galendromus occidentalis]
MEIEMDPGSKIISIKFGNSLLNNRDAIRKMTASQMELPKQERKNTSFASEWQEFVGDFPHAETYLQQDFVDRVFPSFKECVLAKEHTDTESVSDASSDDGNSLFSGCRSPVSKEDGDLVPIIKLMKPRSTRPSADSSH